MMLIFFTDGAMMDSNDIENKEEYTTFSHKDLIEITKTTLNELVQSDSLLSDLPSDVSVEEVKAQLALEHGQSMIVYFDQADGEALSVVVCSFF